MILRFIILHMFFLAALYEAHGQAPSEKIEKIIYKQGRCNGNCPRFSIVIDSLGNYRLQGEIFLTKNKNDTATSGRYEGKIDYQLLKDIWNAAYSIPKSNLPPPEETSEPRSSIELILVVNKQNHMIATYSNHKELQPLISLLTKLALSDQPRRIRSL